MKTQTYLLTALAIIIQAMVSGQTQESPSNSTKKVRAVIGTFNPKTQTATTSFKEFSFRSGNDAEINEPNIQAAPLAGYNKSLQIKGTTKDVKELQEQVEEMQSIEKQLRLKAQSITGAEKQKMLEAANGLAKQIEFVMIQTSEISGRIHLETFEFNKEIYELVLNGYNGNNHGLVVSEELTLEADASIKLAKEMRQEAYAMPNNAAKLGTLMNAEEKETVALTKQAQAIEVLKKSNTNSIIAVK